MGGFGGIGEVFSDKEGIVSSIISQQSQSPLSPDEEDAIRKNQEAIEQADIIGKQLDKNTKYAQATAFLPGIYGYVEDYFTGERVVLSLTPYEISPRLSDSRLFTISAADFKTVKDEYPKALGSLASASLKTAMTVGNRLNAAKVATNFMQEVLSPEEDKRYISKDKRVGQLSRFLSSKGAEEDRSAFLHITPDVDETGGRIPILYRQWDEDGKPIDEPGVAYVNVNFNFVSTKYTLTVKEFILQNVSENSQEIYSLDKSFDGVNLRFFGSQPKIIQLSGILSNFDDDIIGLDEEIERQLSWSGGDPVLQQPLPIGSKGSQRDVFISYYNTFLKGTKAKDFSIKVYLYYNFKIIEGFLVSMGIQTSSDNDNFVRFNAQMIVKREVLAFEMGKGLAGGKGSLIKKNLGVYSNQSKLGVFGEQNAYRNNYRTYALKRSRDVLNQTVSDLSISKHEDSYIDSDLKTLGISTMLRDYDDSPPYDSSNEGIQYRPDEKAWFLGMIESMIDAIKIATITTGDIMFSEDSDVIASDAYERYISGNKGIAFTDFIKKLITHEDDKTYYITKTPTAADMITLYTDAANNVHLDYDTTTEGRGSILNIMGTGDMISDTTGTKTELIKIHFAINNKYYTAKSGKYIDTLESWWAEYDTDGNPKT